MHQRYDSKFSSTSGLIDGDTLPSRDSWDRLSRMAAGADRLRISSGLRTACKEFRNGEHDAALQRITKLREERSADFVLIETAGRLLCFEAHFLKQMRREADAVKRTQDWLAHQMSSNEKTAGWYSAVVEAFFLLGDLAWDRGDMGRFLSNSKTARTIARMSPEDRPGLNARALEHLLLALCYNGKFAEAHDQLGPFNLAADAEANCSPRFLALSGAVHFAGGAKTKGLELIRAAFGMRAPESKWTYAPPRNPRNLLSSIGYELNKNSAAAAEARAVESILLELSRA